jgi:flagellar biosynthesis protein FliR
MIVLDAPHLLDTLVTFMLISIRISAMLISAPMFSSAPVTVPVRIVVALSIAVLMLEAVTPPALDILSPRGILAIAGEAVIGLILGFMFQLAFAAVAMAGEQISSSMGLGFAAMVDPQSGTQSPVITQFMTVTMLIVFMTIEGPHILFKQLAASFVAMPIGDAFLRPDMIMSLLRSAGILFSAALLISLPIVLALFLVTLLIGVLTRVAPQLNLFSVGFSISIIAGLLLLLIAFPGMTRSMSGLLDEFAQKAQLLFLPAAGG